MVLNKTLAILIIAIVTVSSMTIITTIQMVELGRQLESRYEILQQRVLSIQQNYTSLLSNYTSLHASYLSLLTRHKALQSSYDSLRSEHLALQQSFETLKQENSILRARFESLYKNYTSLLSKYNSLVSDYNSLTSKYNELWSKYTKLLTEASENSTAVTLIYYTGFGKEEHVLSFSIPYDLYESYHERPHPEITTYDTENVLTYITPNDPIIQQIISTIASQTESEEELADALLDLVQYKGHALSIRYYPTTENKYPIETLVEMGGDCDTHAILYATLLKAAGLKALVLLSEDGTHAAVAVHLRDPPSHNNQPAYHYFEYKGEKYYYAETTSWGWLVGDEPSDLQGTEFYLIEV